MTCVLALTAITHRSVRLFDANAARLRYVRGPMHALTDHLNYTLYVRLAAA